MDWASMLIRMYRMWGLRRGYEVSTIEEMFGEEAGIKVTVLTDSLGTCA